MSKKPNRTSVSSNNAQVDVSLNRPTYLLDQFERSVSNSRKSFKFERDIVRNIASVQHVRRIFHRVSQDTILVTSSESTAIRSHVYMLAKMTGFPDPVLWAQVPLGFPWSTYYALGRVILASECMNRTTANKEFCTSHLGLQCIITKIQLLFNHIHPSKVFSFCILFQVTYSISCDLEMR